MSFENYQNRVSDWLRACFSDDVRTNERERAFRFLEESIELAQASGCSKLDAIALVNYVYGRPTGDAEQEAGGVLVTLAGLCSAKDIELVEAGEKELSRNWDRIQKIQKKHAAKVENSPLP